MPLDHYVTLGRSGLRVSPFALGAMNFGEDPPGAGSSVEESEKILATYLDLGGNFVDTANFYTNGHSEKILEYSLLARTVEGELAPFARDQGLALVPWSPLRNGFLSGKYRRGTQVTDSARATHIPRPADSDYAVIDAVVAIAGELATTPAAVSLAWLRTRPGTVVPIIGARRLSHLTDNLAGLDVTLTPEHLRTLDEVSAPTLDYPAPMHGSLRAMLQFAGTTVDGETSVVYPPLLESDVRY